MKDIFISHVEEDQAVALQMAEVLEANGYSVWYYERDSLPGLTYLQQIVQAIEQSRFFIILLSHKSLSSFQVDREVVGAFESGKKIVPVLLGMSFADFKRLKPEWVHCVGAAGGIRIAEDGVAGMMPKLLGGLALLRAESKKPASPTTVHAATLVAPKQPPARLPGVAAPAKDHPKELVLDLGRDVKLALVLVPAGGFIMGTPEDEEAHCDDEIQHEVTISRPFYLAKTELTQAQYMRVMGDNPSYFAGPELPVENVTWFEAQAFCKKLTEMTGHKVMLPTEAQWEYACRAGTRTTFAVGDTITTEDANFDGKYTYRTAKKGVARQQTITVAAFSPNPWGLHDMHGNIWEWCQDWYGEYPAEAVTDPQGPATGDIRVRRGGSWFDGPEDCRSGLRDALDPGRRNRVTGFRILIAIPE